MAIAKAALDRDNKRVGDSPTTGKNNMPHGWVAVLAPIPTHVHFIPMRNFPMRPGSQSSKGATTHVQN